MGRYIVEQLLERGDEVRVFSRGKYDDLAEKGVDMVQGDLQSFKLVNDACKGVDAVFHVAAMAGMWGDPRKFFNINVNGTDNVIHGCLENGVKKLIYTSSPSAIFGKDDIAGKSEADCPYPEAHLSEYARTKAIAEGMVLKEDQFGELMTVALRPHLIWGPRDNHIIPRLLNRARSGKLKRVGDGTNLVDIVYVENATKAHLQAADALTEDSPVRGKAYFISQGEPVNLWDWINDLLGMLNVPKVKKSVSFCTAYKIGSVLEALYKLFMLKGEPPMTRFIALQLAKSHYFDISAAKRDFGYSPEVSTKEGLKRLVKYLKDTGGI